jgi:hypothetical protein
MTRSSDMPYDSVSIAHRSSSARATTYLRLVHGNGIPRHEWNLRAREQAVRLFVPQLADSAVGVDRPRLPVVEAHDRPRAMLVRLCESLDLVFAVLGVRADDRGAGIGRRARRARRLGALVFVIEGLLFFLVRYCLRHAFGAVALECHDGALGAVYEACSRVEVLLKDYALVLLDVDCCLVPVVFLW